MDILRILCYFENDSDVIFAWYNQQDAEIQAKTDAIIEVMQTIPSKWWRMPDFRRLNRASQGLSTVRIISDERVHYRIFGFFGPKEDVHYTMLLPMKKVDDPDYSRSGPEAFRRRDLVLRGGRVDEWAFPKDSNPEAKV